ncbi:MAG: site-2 protease family protein [bacterium]|nr:site-2 protease family protein [bacterium]
MELKVFQIIILIFSAIVHEYMHGWTAHYLGDPTAKDAGRLTLNPIPHIDLYGSIVLPFIFILFNSPFIFGWAKPVPFNPYNLLDQKYGSAKVALAGPMSNFVLALFFGLLIRFFSGYLMIISPLIINFLYIIVFINLLLMVLNLLPIPPLDGSKVILPFLPYDWQTKLLQLEQYGFILVLLFIFFGFSLIVPVINLLFRLIVVA